MCVHGNCRHAAVVRWGACLAGCVTCFSVSVRGSDGTGTGGSFLWIVEGWGCLRTYVTECSRDVAFKSIVWSGCQAIDGWILCCAYRTGVSVVEVCYKYVWDGERGEMTVLYPQVHSRTPSTVEGDEWTVQ